VSQRSDRVPAFHAMAMSRLASERELAGHQVLHLEVGQPSTGAPQAAREAVTEALGRPDITLGYTGATGLYSLRRRIAEQYLTDHAVNVDSRTDRMIVSGASAGFTLAFLAAFEPGARVGVLEPGYPCYRNTLWALDMTPVMIPVGPETRWAPTTEILDQVIRLRPRGARWSDHCFPLQSDRHSAERHCTSRDHHLLLIGGDPFDRR
jgi:aspartate/methionine/tyrosine aminotransferase